MEKKIELKNLKGTFDFLPEQQSLRAKIMDVLKKNFAKYGYLPLETPILNDFDLLKYKYEDGAEILNEIYTLRDQGMRKIGLRYDLTIPFCKVIGLNKNLAMPFRRYEIGKVFRDGPVKAGRAREFYQCDVDVVGIDGRFVEIEQMQMVISVFKELGIDVEIRWNNRKLMYGIILDAGIEEGKIDSVVGLIDRLDKISREELMAEFSKLEISENQVNVLLDDFSKSLDDLNEKYCQSTNNILQEGLQECLDIQKLIDELNLQNNTKFTPKLARGLGIYTNTVFEFYDKQGRISSSLGGGGRFNKIITEFMDNGIEYPAVGLSFGLEPIYYILSEQEQQRFVDVLIVPMGTEIECIKVAEILRKNNINAIVDFNNKKVKKSFEYANKTNIKYVIVIGEDEISKQMYSIKDLDTGTQQILPIDEIVKLMTK